MENKKIIQEERIVFRVFKNDKIKYKNLAKLKKVSLSELIKILLNKELKK